MKFALVNGQRNEAQPSVPGVCQNCDQPVVAKCGELRIWHWAHKGKRQCDPWWENETEWHLNWKSNFPDSWREIVHRANDGTRHIADIKTEHGWVIEFQHSSINPEERRSRDAFYGRLIWVVDGTRRKRDAEQFQNSWNHGTAVGNSSNLRRIYSGDSALLREWSSSLGPIFIDFGGQLLGWVLPGRQNGAVYVALFPRNLLIHILRTGIVEKGLNFDGLVKEFSESIVRHERQLQLR